MAETVTCPACGLRLRGIPQDRRLLVTCPTKAGGCGTKFYFPAVERSTIGFRCSRDGQPFTVTFKRDLPTQKFAIERIQKSSGTNAGPSTSAFESHAADAYNFNSFYCPCCGYSPPEVNESRFVKCGRCASLVCAGLVYHKQDASGAAIKWFVCYPDCGNQGQITHEIYEYQATRDKGAVRVAARTAPVLPKPETPASKMIGKG